MIYIVSGLMRSGTSMMMRSLEAGGLDAVYDKSFDEIALEKWTGVYSPCVRSFYEINNKRKRFLDDKFISECNGKLLKVLLKYISNFPYITSGIKVVVMRRDISEIKLSADYYFENMGHGRSPSIVEHEKLLIDGMENLTTRDDLVGCTEVWYKDVLNNPIEVFTNLRFCGFDIDPIESSKISNRKHKHY